MGKIAYRCPLSNQEQVIRREVLREVFDSLDESDAAALVAHYEKMNDVLTEERDKKHIGFGFQSYLELIHCLCRKGVI